MASSIRSIVEFLRIIASEFQPQTRPWTGRAGKPEWHHCVECIDSTRLTGPSGAVRRRVPGLHNFTSVWPRNRWSVVDLWI